MNERLTTALEKTVRAKQMLLEWDWEVDSLPQSVDDLQMGSAIALGLLMDKILTMEQAVAFVSKAVNVAYQMGKRDNE